MHRALVIGGGIAGPAAAIALARAGVACALCEAELGATADGHLTLATNGFDALAALDLHAPVAELGFPVTRSVVVDRRGRRLGELPFARPRPDGIVSRVVRRGELRARLLEEAMRQGVQVELGKRLVAVREDDERVVARFGDETEAEADLLVGADGIGSRVRRLVAPDAASPRATGALHFAGVTPGVAAAAEPGTWTLQLARRALFAYVTSDQGDTIWQALVPKRTPLDDAEREAADPEAWRSWLLGFFAAEEAMARALVAAGALERCAENGIELEPPEPWHAGRLVLVGDAAHASAPTSGQGVSMAIEDAVALGRALRDLPDPGTAFAAYQALRAPRAARVVAEGRRGGVRRMPGPLGRRIRDWTLRLALRTLVTSRSLAWLYDHHVEWDEPVAPPAPRRR